MNAAPFDINKSKYNNQIYNKPDGKDQLKPFNQFDVYNKNGGVRHGNPYQPRNMNPSLFLLIYLCVMN